MEQCVGYPAGHVCMVVVPDDRATGLCYSCLGRRAEYESHGLGRDPVRVGVVLESLEAPIPVCRCGGLADSPDHVHSLLHAVWVSKLQSTALPVAVIRRKRG